MSNDKPRGTESEVKTITLDFKTYEEELNRAKLDGFEVFSGLQLRLAKAVEKINSGNYDSVHSGKIEIYKIIDEVSRYKAPNDQR
jgi:hypothetical protein